MECLRFFCFFRINKPIISILFTLQSVYFLSKLVKSEYKSTDNIYNLPTMKELRSVFYSNASRILKEGSNNIEIDSFAVLYPFHIRTLKLEVTKVKFNSPGSTDFAGVGKVLEIIKEFAFYYFPNKKNVVQKELLEKNVELKEQEVIKMKIENLKAMGFLSIQIQTMLGLEYYYIGKLKKLNDNGQIVNIEISDENK